MNTALEKTMDKTRVFREKKSGAGWDGGNPEG